MSSSSSLHSPSSSSSGRWLSSEELQEYFARENSGSEERFNEEDCPFPVEYPSASILKFLLAPFSCLLLVCVGISREKKVLIQVKNHLERGEKVDGNFIQYCAYKRWKMILNEIANVPDHQKSWRADEWLDALSLSTMGYMKSEANPGGWCGNEYDGFTARIDWIDKGVVKALLDCNPYPSDQSLEGKLTDRAWYIIQKCK